MSVYRKRFTLIREAPEADRTMGTLLVGSSFLAFTLEPGYADVKHPRVDPGFYLLTPHGWEIDSPYRYKRVWALVGKNVSHQPEPGCERSAILIHAGNVDDETKGCILLGMERGEVFGEPGVVRSREALDRMRDILGNREGYLTIMEG